MALGGNPARRQADIGFAAVLIAAAGWCYAEAGSYPGMSGAYPRVLTVLLGTGAALVILRGLLRPAAPNEPRFFGHPGRFVLGFAVILAYVLAIGAFGFLLPSLVLGVALPVLLGYRDHRLTVPVTLGTLAFIVLVFFVLLERPLPPDLLDPVLESFR